MQCQTWKLYHTPEYIKCVLLPLTEVVDLTMNLISRTHYFYEKREYVFNVLLEYYIIMQTNLPFLQVRDK